MALLETWRNLAYGNGTDNKEKDRLWEGYFAVEKGIYEKLYMMQFEGGGYCEKLH